MMRMTDYFVKYKFLQDVKMKDVKLQDKKM